MSQLGFIGAGNMARAIIGGIVTSRLAAAEDIIVSNPSQGKLDALQQTFGVKTTQSNTEAAKAAEKYLFLCVKPGILPGVIAEIRESVPQQTMVISVAAGKTIASIEEAFSKKLPLIRVMPNTPALVGAGCSAVCANEEAKQAEHREAYEGAVRLCESFGTVTEMPEHLIDVAGQVAGASPAWFFMILEALADGAVAEGMPRDMAYELAASSMLGAGKLALSRGGNPGALKDMVTSPGGTTIQGVRVLEEQGVRGAFMDAVIAACARARAL